MLKQVLDVGSLASGLSQSMRDIVKVGTIAPNPISGVRGHEVTNLSSLDCSS